MSSLNLNLLWADLESRAGGHVTRALADYFKAFAKRAWWLRADLVFGLGHHERRLREEWELRRAQIEDEIGDDKAAEAMRLTAQSIYVWVERGQEQGFSRDQLSLLMSQLHPILEPHLEHRPGGAP